jgi:hypothetical protein
MTQDALAEQLGVLAEAVRADSRWQQDDISVAVLGMLLYGFALMTGRTVMFLNVEDIDAAVLQCLTKHVGAAAKWSTGLVADASASAFDKARHPANHELIGVGHSYFGVENQKAVVDNVFANIGSVRRRVQGSV